VLLGGEEGAEGCSLLGSVLETLPLREAVFKEEEIENLLSRFVVVDVAVVAAGAGGERVGL